MQNKRHTINQTHGYELGTELGNRDGKVDGNCVGFEDGFLLLAQ